MCQSAAAVVGSDGDPTHAKNAEATDQGGACMFVFFSPSQQLHTTFFQEGDCTHCEHTQTRAAQISKSCKLKCQTHICVDVKLSYKGPGGLKEDPAGYYGMPGICWEYWPACLSTQSLERLDCTLSLCLYLCEKIQQGEEKETWRWGGRGTEQEMSVWRYSRETGGAFVCVCVCVAEGGVVPCPVQH